ncbi:MAG: hypothetical protein ACJAT7_002050 [Psychromonas sp.]|jgi:hypothetical protein|uniref:phage tail-collar fiber domain-containing protein n=1 Tax=Psychromonas sp. TaxID=1884585 RepID=UPI0039E2EB9F
MSQTAIPREFERYLQNKISVGQAPDMNEMIFAYIPGLDLGIEIDRDLGLPDIALWVHQQDIDQVGKLGNNALAYSVVIPGAVPAVTFNAIYLRDKNVPNSCGMVVHKVEETKEDGMASTKSLTQQYDGAAQMAGITIDAQTWQIDYQARLFGIEEDHRLTCLDNYGHTAFVNGFDVTQEADPTKYKITPGLVYLGGLRAVLENEVQQTITNKPNMLFVDVVREGTVLSKWYNLLTITLSETELVDYIDVNGMQHYVAKLATVNVAGAITDERINYDNSQLVIEENTPVAASASACVCFTFDDGYLSQLPLADEFEARGVFFGLASNSIDESGYISAAQALDLEARGFEFFNHGLYPHLDMRDGSPTTYAQALAEINGAHNLLLGKGITPKGFVSPMSEIKREFLPIIDNLYSIAYTIYQGLSAGSGDPDIQVIDSPVYATKMCRASLYQHTVEECKLMIDRAIATQGLLTFYDHDPAGTQYAMSASQADILEVLDYAIAQEVQIILPSEVPGTFDVEKIGGGIYSQIEDAQLIPNKSYTQLRSEYEQESKDCAIAFDGTISIKRSGVYLFEIGTMFVTGASTRVITTLDIDKTGSYRNKHNGYHAEGGTSASSYSGINFAPITLVKGQKVNPTILQDSGGDKAISGGQPYSFVNVTKVG